ncbi:hypothetical protein [Pseudomonas costantinii]|uniref:hypothetical protein n=1 Tax=Pseudomonas costantinii TaxID=168469 RepID=UPI0015A10A75|nr:hypothetical protein [Pseudomonas costantinii]NVZ72232.1 hypothetical protein [Pseudomonas costantinii]
MSTVNASTPDLSQTFFLVKVGAAAVRVFDVTNVTGTSSGAEVLSKTKEKLEFFFGRQSGPGSLILDPTRGDEIIYTDPQGETYNGPTSGRCRVTFGQSGAATAQEGDLENVQVEGKNGATALLNGQYRVLST